ncbi:MAG: DNA methylase [Betaproteobacteria bacterium RIFCSPLOWO2_02_FULL_62_17]|nr:MAG: DNA methylase [Betaproteobacteria bacterium RIFCSPLOWO2_02_FULL_62_17]
MSKPDEIGHFATCPRGLEALLATELECLGAGELKATAGGVAFQADRRTCYRANLESRLATRILRRLDTNNYRNEQEIYDITRALPWNRWFKVSQSIRVDINASRSPLKSLDFATLRIKDAVCDRFRDDTGSRPDVNTREPDIRIQAYLDAQAITLYLDTSGEPLYKRGFRVQSVEAPLKENLAAGIITLTGWQPEETLLDPMCGGGTLLSEAAMIGLKIPPGAARGFGFERLNDFDSGAWASVRKFALGARTPDRKLSIHGSDLHYREVEYAKENLRAAGLGDVVQVKQASATDLRAPSPEGVMVMNPPYGERLGEKEELAALYPQLGDWMKRYFAGWRCYYFTGDPELPKGIRLKASKRTPLFNGAIECRLFEYKIIAGSNRREKS